MVKTCPSTLCKHENQDSSYYCEKCGLRLNMEKTEVEGRDKLFLVMQRVIKELGPEIGFPKEDIDTLLKMDRKGFDAIIGNHVGKMFLIFSGYADTGSDHKAGNPDTKPKKEEHKITDPLELEREKLKVLKEISESLKKQNKKNIKSVQQLMRK